MPPNNPFRPAVAVEPKVKLLLFGMPGVGKTYFGLASPGKVAVIDTEGGTAFYAARKGLSEFDVLTTKSYRDVVQALDFLAQPGSGYETVLVDPVTILYDQLQEAALKGRERKVAAKGGNPDEADLEMLDWGRIKRHYKAVMRRLTNLPIHVVVTAREKDVTEKRGSDMVKVGVRPDAEKGTAYEFDVVLRMIAKGGQRIAIVEKDRTGTLALGQEIEGPTFTGLFGRFAAQRIKGAVARVVPNDEAAAESDADAFATQGAAIDASQRRASARATRQDAPAGAKGAPVALATNDATSDDPATPEQVVALVEALDAAGVDGERLREQRSLPPFIEMSATKVAALIGWASDRAAALAAQGVEAEHEAMRRFDAEEEAA